MIAEFFAGLVRAALRILTALFVGIFRAPATALESQSAPSHVREVKAPAGDGMLGEVLDLPRGSKGRRFVAEQNGLIMAVALVEGAELKALAVHPEHRGRGHGRNLTREVRAHLGAPMSCTAPPRAFAAYLERIGWLRRAGDTWWLD